jgi:uncharacterized membrane protein YccC
METTVKNRGINGQLGAWIIATDNPPSIGYTAQTAVASVVSYLIAHLFRLPEAYWGRLVALHRFFEVSIGIAVGLVFFALWSKIAFRPSAKAASASSAL